MNNNDKDIYFLKKAIELADENSASGRNGPFGAIIVKDNKIIGEGRNKVVETNDPTAHAEINAIRKACQELNSNELRNCTIYSSCEPCPMCLSAILWARIDRIVYAATREDAARAGFDDKKILQEVKKSWGERQVNSRRIKLDPAWQVFENWINNPAKKTY